MDFKLNDTEIDLENKISRIGDRYMIGSIAACFTTLAFVPQAIKVIKTKDTAGISLEMLLLYPATFFLGAGIFLGAVWANVSWGRYWAWDPKEVWALITFLVYGAAFHSQSLRIFRKPLFFHIYMILAFLTVLMTYFGVNYVLGGMHSYANS